jgi:hypothetical protein
VERDGVSTAYGFHEVAHYTLHPRWRGYEAANADGTGVALVGFGELVEPVWLHVAIVVEAYVHVALGYREAGVAGGRYAKVALMANELDCIPGGYLRSVIRGAVVYHDDLETASGIPLS